MMFSYFKVNLDDEYFLTKCLCCFALGELLNIKDAYAHPLFYRAIDDSTGFRTR